MQSDGLGSPPRLRPRSRPRPRPRSRPRSRPRPPLALPAALAPSPVPAMLGSMLFVKKAALRPVPRWAVVDDVAVGAVEETLGEEGDRLQDSLDGAYREMDRR